MLTIAYLIWETWRVLWRPRATVVRKSSFRTLQRTERPVIPLRQAPQDQQQQQQQQQQQHQQLDQQASSWNNDLASASAPVSYSPRSSPKQQRHLEQIQGQSNVSGTGDDRKGVVRAIPIVPSKQIVPSVSQPSHSAIQPQTTDTTQAPPPPPSPKLQQKQQEQQQQQQQPQQHQQQQHKQPSHIPTPVQKSVKTLVLEQPPVSEKKMDEIWAKKQIDKFSFGFDEADKDKSGSLSFDEVYNVLQKHGFKGTTAAAKFIFGHMDKDGSQAVSREEFSTAMNTVPRMSIREFVYRKAFKQMDKDNSGFLTKTEIMDATKNEGGIEIGSKVISDLLVYIHKDDNEQVDYEEFLRVLGIQTTGSVLQKIFKAMDKDGSGFLTRDEMMDAVSNEFELKLSAESISQLLIDLVKDSDKKMSYDEFVESWLKQKAPKKK